MSKYIDFDAYREEREKDVITIHMYGEEIEIPAQPTLALMEKVLEFTHQKEQGEVLADQEIIYMIENLIGKEQYKQMKENGASIQDAEWLITKVQEIYRNVDAEDDTKNLTPSTSPKSGEASKQTSKESME